MVGFDRILTTRSISAAWVKRPRSNRTPIKVRVHCAKDRAVLLDSPMTGASLESLNPRGVG